MRNIWLLCVLLGTLAWGQAAPPPAQPGQAAPAMGMRPQPSGEADSAAASVPATAAVITIDGVCTPKPKPAAAKGATVKPMADKTTPTKSDAPCKTVITKAEFEKLVGSLAPNASPQQKKQLANLLPRYLAMSNQAKKDGLDKTDAYKETLKFAQMQILSSQLQRKIQEDAGKVGPGDIDSYYLTHKDAFEQYNVDRIYVPRTKQGAAAAGKDDDDKDDKDKDKDKDEKLTDDQKKAKEAADKAKAEENEQAMTKLADYLRTRAAAGEDIVKLQKEAFEAAGMKIESPTVNLPNIRRTALPPGHAAIFDLKPGEVSQVISDSGGHYIYKMNSVTEMTLDQATNEITGKLKADRMKEEMDKVNSSFKVEKNEAYFGPDTGPMPPRGPRPGPGMRPGMQGPGAAQPPTAPPAAQTPAPEPN
jgi:hypothetical protein